MTHSPQILEYNYDKIFSSHKNPKVIKKTLKENSTQLKSKESCLLRAVFMADLEGTIPDNFFE